MKIITRLGALLRRKKLDAEMAEEMRLHLELQAERNLAAGMGADEARYAAQREFGNVGVIQQRAREQRGWRWLDELWIDLLFAGRMQRKHPGFTVAAVLTLALGIGFVTTLFTMVNGVAFGELPFEEPQRIVSIGLPAAQFDECARRQRSCEAISSAQTTSADLHGDGFVSRYPAAVVADNFLAVLRARPLLGRGFLPEDARPAAGGAVLIAHSVWAQEFGRSEAIVGREIRVNGETRTIVGVMPAGFGFPLKEEVWIPRRTNEPMASAVVFGRLRAGVSLRQATEEFSALSRQLAGASPGRDGPLPVVEVVPFTGRYVKEALRIMLSAVLGATFLVLLLACANVANLILVRTLERRKELAVRAALGANRMRLIRQMLVESASIAAMGAVGGIVAAGWSTQALWSYIQQERPLTGGAPFWINFDLDGRVFAFVAAVAVLATLVTGLAPALRASRVDVNETLKDGGGAGLRLSRFVQVLVNGQMALSVCLVTVAGLFVTVLAAFNHKTLPYAPAQILTARVSLDGRAYDDPAKRRQFFQQLVERLNAVAGVEAAALDSAESLRHMPNPQIAMEGAIHARDVDRPECALEFVSDNFLDGFGVGLVDGRTFAPVDDVTAPAVAVVNTEFARRFGRDERVIGRRFRLAASAGGEPDWITVIGVAPDLGSVKAGQTSRGPVIYRPLAQASERAVTVLVRGRGDAGRFAGVIRGAVAALDPDVPVGRLQTVRQIIELERIGMNTFGSLFVLCGLGALLLASVGIYGVIAFGVKLRTREFGVRMALGADRGAITRLVLGDGLRQIAIGSVVGVLLALAASLVLSATVIGIGRTPYDGWIYLGAAISLVGVAGMALLVPARKAARVDPIAALRAE